MLSTMVNTIFCSGMPRSGSTWSYNVCRYLLKALRPEQSLVAGFFGEGPAAEDYVDEHQSLDDILLIKFHHPGI